MQLFQHRMRTSQHVKSVQSIMTRTSHHFNTTKTNFKKLSPQGDNITTYLRKFQIKKENDNLAKRIHLCQSQHSKERYSKEWENIKRFMKVRSNFKKNLFTNEPKIYKFQPISGKGKLKINFKVTDIEMPLQFWSRKNMYKLSFSVQNTEIEPDKRLITMDLMKSYETTFYAPLSFKRKTTICKILKVFQLEQFEVGRFQVNFSSQNCMNEGQVTNKLGRKIGKIKFFINLQQGMKKIKKLSVLEKQNLPSLMDPSGETAINRTNQCDQFIRL